MPDERGGLGVADAARALGISPAALRRRIDRRTVNAYKDEQGNWRVIVEESSDTGPTTGPTTTPDGAATMDAGLVQTLQEQLGFLQRELEARNREIEETRRIHAEQIRELHILLQTSQQNEQRLLSATVPDGPGSIQTDRDEKAPGSDANAAPGGVQRQTGVFSQWRGWFSRRFGGE